MARSSATTSSKDGRAAGSRLRQRATSAPNSGGSVSGTYSTPASRLWIIINLVTLPSTQ